MARYPDAAVRARAKRGVIVSYAVLAPGGTLQVHPALVLEKHEKNAVTLAIYTKSGATEVHYAEYSAKLKDHCWSPRGASEALSQRAG